MNLKTAQVLGLALPPTLARQRRKSDRVTMLFAAVHESVIGPSRPCPAGDLSSEPDSVDAAWKRPD